MAAGVGTTGQFNANGITPTPFFNDPGVRQQLNMNANQYGTLSRTYQTAYSRYNRALNNLNPNLTEQQRMARIQQLQAAFNQQVSGTVNNTFNNPQMLERYNQLNRQYMGFNAFNNPTVQQQLNLSPQQLQQIRSLANSWRQQLQQFRQGAGNNLTNVDRNQWNELWMQYQNRLNSILTPQQQQTWMQQIGRPYTFSPSLYNSEFGNTGAVTTPGSTVPKYVPLNNGTQTQQTPTGTRAATNQGTPTPSNQGGTVR